MHESSFYYKVLHSEKLPISLRKATVLLSSWLFQGLLHTDVTEKAYKIALDVLFFTIIGILLLAFGQLPLPIHLSLAIIIAHTLNYLFNGQLFVALKNIGKTEIERKSFINYASYLSDRIRGEKSLSAAALFGSLSRNELGASSDLDVRLIRRPGYINGILACTFVLKERTRALIRRFPLDIYVLDSVNWLKTKLRENEFPIIIVDHEDQLRKSYREWKLFADLEKAVTG